MLNDVDGFELSRRFAYQPSSRPPNPTGPSRRPAPTPTATDTPDRLSDSQLCQLSKCIGCGLEWTSKKTPKQKRTHLNHCAKKNALTNDTIRILVEKEIRVQLPESTLIDSVLGPAKKSKRLQCLPTVRSLPETRDSILGRARHILGHTDPHHADPRPTQQFGHSALARRQGRPTSLDMNRATEEPPSTQPFGASSLPRKMTPESKLLFAQESTSSSDRRKRAASPPFVGSNPRTVRQRLQ